MPQLNSWAFILLFCGILGAQDATNLDLERIFSRRDFVPERATPLRFLASGEAFTRLERDDKGRVELVSWSLPSLRRKVLVSAADLIPEGTTSPLTIEDYAWSADSQRLLLFTNSKRVWRDNTRGDYWVFDITQRTLNFVGRKDLESQTMFAKFDASGHHVVYVSMGNVYSQSLADGTITALTKDGNGTIINGTSDWVYEEELGLRDGIVPSPDGKQVAYWRFDTEGIGHFLMIDNLAGPYAKTIPVQFPKVGTKNSAVRVGVVARKGGDTTWIKIPGDPREHYIARMHWTPDGRSLLIQQLNRDQNENRVWLADAKTGEVRSLFVERDDAWVDVREENDIHWLKDGRSFFWLSERGGWRRLWRMNLDENKPQCVTPGERDVIGVARIDEPNARINVIASPSNATRRALWSVSLTTGEWNRVTPLTEVGYHDYQISPDGAWAVHTWSQFDRPSRIELISLPGHAVITTFVDNAAVKKQLGALARGPREFLQVPIDKDVTLDAWIMHPPNFDPKKKYPVLFYVYGEPWSQTVVDRFGGSRYLWHLYLTQLGYVVASVDNRGTPGPKGRAWRKHVHRGIGVEAPIDQANAVKTLLAARPYLDQDRVGYWGWSGGGSMSLHMIFKYPKLVKMAMSVAPVTDLALYDTIYEERYMGVPSDNPEGYKNGSPLNFAHQLEGDLLLVHGTHDDNVHYQHAELLIDKLIEHNKVFEMMSYPNRSHGIFERRNTRRHLFETLTAYLRRKLPLN